jgi:hypothetical protein
MKRKHFLLFLMVVMAVFTSCEEEEPLEVTKNYIKEITTPTLITANKTWYVEGDIYVTADLTIEAGTTIKFMEGASLNIGYNSYGSLKALGTAEKPIIFTSAATNKSAGDWDGIFFHVNNSSTATELKYCVFEYGGLTRSDKEEGSVIELNGTHVKMNNCIVKEAPNCGIYLDENSDFVEFNNNTIEKCASHPMVMSASAVGSIGLNNKFVTTDNYGIWIFISDIKTNVSWNKQTVPYFIQGWIEVDANNAVLTIEQGTTIKFFPEGVLRVGYSNGGKLIAQGTQIAPIVFTSAAASPSKGDWKYLEFSDNTSAGTILEFCTVEYAGGYDNNDEDAAIYVYTNNLTIKNCIIREIEGKGIIVGSGYTPTLSGNIFSENNNIDVEHEE